MLKKSPTLLEDRSEIVRCQKRQDRLEQTVLPLNFPPPIGGSPYFGDAEPPPLEGRAGVG